MFDSKKCVRILDTFTYEDGYITNVRDREHEKIHMIKNKNVPLPFETSQKLCGENAKFQLNGNSYCESCTKILAGDFNWE